jgi:hypothetical protein
MTTELDPFFAELEAEIEKAKAKSSLKKDAEKLRKDANNMRLEAHIRRRASEELKALQAILDATAWKPIAIGALFTEQHCDGCDTIHRTFLQYMQQEQKISQPSTKRWVRISTPELSLPHETIVQPIRTHICAACAPEHGFDADFPTIRLMPSLGTLTVSSTYVQGDINAQNEAD